MSRSHPTPPTASPPPASPSRAHTSYTPRPAPSLDPAALLAIRDLELRTRLVMEGVRAGLHRSPFNGWAAEFTEYRQYAPGDDLRHLDWRVLARTDRHFLKKYEDETNLRCWLLVDSSASMSFGARGVTKSDYARTLVATLAWFLHEQRDLVGTALFDESIHDVVTPRSRPGHLRRVLAALARPSNGRDTHLEAALAEIARLARRRSLIVIVSDFLTPPANWSRALAELTAARHDVRALQILDPAEISLEGFGRPALWEDIETGETRYVDPARATDLYRRRLEEHTAELHTAFNRARVSRQLITTDEPLDTALLRFLNGKARSNEQPAPTRQGKRVAQLGSARHPRP